MQDKEHSDEKILKELTLAKDETLLFRKIPVNLQGFLLLDLSKYFQDKILNKLSDEEIIKLLRYLGPDRAVTLLRVLDKKRRREKIIKLLKGEIKLKVEFLLKFNPQTAAGLMNLNYIEVEKDSTVGEVTKLVQEYERKTKRFPEILVVESGYLLGELEAQSLFSDSNNKIEKYIQKTPSVLFNKEEKEVLDLFRKNPHKQIVVLAEDKSIIGIIYSDDILKLINQEVGKDLSSFAGISEREEVNDPFLVKVKNRYKWLIINLGTAFLAAFVVSLFEETISAFVLLAVYMPIVAGMGGNAGNQTLAVMVRGLALRKVKLKTVKKVVLNEVIAGAINGLIMGVIVALVASFFNQNSLLGLIVGVAMVINLVIAGFFGAVIPLLMRKLGKDPASSATIFITTATDVFGFFVFLGLATILL